MKTCSECGREFLDSYEDCPFCERANEEDAVSSSHEGDASSRPAKRPLMLIAVAGLLAVVGVAAIAFAVTRGTASAPPADAAPQAVCFVNQSTIEQRAALMQAEQGVEADLIDELLPSYLKAIPECPEGGSYSIDWTASLPRVTCSVHGWHGTAE